MLFILEKKEQDVRMWICKHCPEFKPKTQQCKICGCFMKAKIPIEFTTCPKDVWENTEMIRRAHEDLQLD